MSIASSDRRVPARLDRQSRASGLQYAFGARYLVLDAGLSRSRPGHDRRLALRHLEQLVDRAPRRPAPQARAPARTA
jgi:hypothetical protein